MQKDSTFELHFCARSWKRAENCTTHKFCPVTYYVAKSQAGDYKAAGLTVCELEGNAIQVGSDGFYAGPQIPIQGP